MPVEALIFDLDGTWWTPRPTSTPPQTCAFNAENAGQSPWRRSAPSWATGARPDCAGLRGNRRSVDPRAIETLYQEFVIYYAAHISAFSKPFPGLIPFLDRCKAEGLAMAVCTNKLEFLSVQLLQALGLSPYFGAVVGPDTIGIAKPDPRPYHEALKRLGHEAASSIMIGDSETDIRTGHNAGVPVIAVSFGYTPEHVSAFNPTHIIDHYDEAWAVIQQYL